MPQVKSTYFETGLDSMKVFFGSFKEGERKLYWASITTKEMSTMTMFDLRKSDSLGWLTDEIEFSLDNSSMKVTVRVLYDPKTEEVKYQWRNENGSSKVASVQLIDRPIQENKLMPNFSVKALDGKPVSLDDLKGKFLVINWWATTCAPCVAEMPSLNKMVEKYQSRDDVKFIAVARDEKEKLERFLAKRDFKYEQTLFTKEVLPIFGDLFPKHIIVNPDGLVTYYAEGGSVNANIEIEKSLESQLEKD